MGNGSGPGFFITGTDTGIGKTYVSRLLADAFASWKKATYMKPVQTGCVRDNHGALTAPDFDFVMAGQSIMTAEMDDHVPYRFEPACSPHLAADRAGIMISIDHIRNSFARIAGKEIVTIVEGAGGVLTPLSETTSMLDLMLHLALPVILVTSPRLGTLNHTFLTIEALEKRNMVPCGVVVNNLLEMNENYLYHDNLRMIRDRLSGAVFLEIGYKGECTDRVKEFSHALYERR